MPLAEFLIGVIAVGRKYGAVTFYRKMLLVTRTQSAMPENDSFPIIL